jgi:type I restriction enzyme, S subunit
MGITPHSAVTEYVWWWFASVDLASLSDGSNVPQINNKDILPLMIPFPPLREQREIVADVERRFSMIEELEKEVEANSQRGSSLRQSILRKVFRGELLGS